MFLVGEGAERILLVARHEYPPRDDAQDALTVYARPHPMAIPKPNDPLVGCQSLIDMPLPRAGKQKSLVQLIKSGLTVH